MRRFLCVALVAAGCTVGGPSQPAAASPSPVRVSAGSPFGAGCSVPGASPGSAVEPDLAVDPGDARHLVAVWQQDRVVRGAALANLVATSRDGGRSWRSRPLPHLTRCSGSPSWTLASDPWVSIGPGGVVYASSLLITPGSPLRSALAVSVSADGGDHWADPVVVQTSADEQIDKPQLLADPRARGVAYAVWVSYPRGQDAGRNRVWLARTTDAGHSWSGPRVIRDAGLEDQFNQLLPGPPGTVYLAFVEASVLSPEPERAPARVEAMRSDDRGETWTQPVAAASIPLTATRDPAGGAVRAFGANLSVAGARDALYLAWSSGAAVSLVRSSDRGETWQRLEPIQDSSPTFLPTVAVAGDGTVGVTLYDFRDYRPGSGAVLTDLWLGQSRDDGKTWATRRVDGPFDLRSAPRSDAGAFIGDYEGLVGLPHAFGALYVVGRPRSGSQPTAVFYRTVGTRA